MSLSLDELLRMAHINTDQSVTGGCNMVAAESKLKIRYIVSKWLDIMRCPQVLRDGRWCLDMSVYYQKYFLMLWPRSQRLSLSTSRRQINSPACSHSSSHPWPELGARCSCLWQESPAPPSWSHLFISTCGVFYGSLRGCHVWPMHV